MSNSNLKIQNITPENEIESSILQDIKNALEFLETQNFILQITEDLKDSPEDYDYTQDDLEQFIFKYELNS